MATKTIFDKLSDLHNGVKDTKLPERKSSKQESKMYVRTLGNTRTAAEAQRIFNPNMPPTTPKGPTEAQMGAGTTSAMDTTGNWGTPERMRS